jgi:hypothetical protein
MTNQYSHVSESTHTFTGERRLKPVVDWLNGTEDLAAKARVERLIAQMVELEKVGFKTGGNKQLAEINKRLASYRMVPNMLFAPSGEWTCDWIPDPELMAATARHHVVEKHTEFHSIVAVVELCKENLLEKLVTCSCGLVFHRKFSHQTHCSEKCRLKQYKASDKWKEYRRGKAREYYALHKNKNTK